jgi:hypothetical protein
MAARLLSREVTGASFSVFSDDDIRRLSVKRITNPVTYTSLQHASPEFVPRLRARGARFPFQNEN